MKKKINKKVLYLLLSLSFLILVIFLFFNNFNNRENSQESVLNYVMQARLANNSLDYKKADSFYSKAYKADPENTNLSEEYLLFSIMQRDFKQSFILAQKIVIKNPQHFLANLIILTEDIKSGHIDSAINNLSSSPVDKDSLIDIILSSLKSYEAMKKNKIEEFEEINSLIKVLAPDFYLYEKGLLNLLNKREVIAEENFFELNNSYVNLESIIYYSKILYKLGEKDKAVNYFSTYLSDNFLTNEKALDYVKEPININDKKVIAEIFYRMSKFLSTNINPVYVYSDNIALVNIVLMLDPDNIPALVDLASFYEMLGDYNNALKLYTSIPNNNYYSRLVSQNVIDINKELGNKKEAISYINSQISSDPYNAKLYVELGLIYHKEQDYKMAIYNYSKALDFSKQYNFKLGEWLAYLFRGISYDKSGDWDSAEKDLVSAYKIDSGDPILINYLAYSRISRDIDIKSSMAMLKKAIDAMPDNPNFLDSYALGLFKEGKYEKALEYSEKANSILSYDPILVSHLADILWQLGYKKEAVETWFRAYNLSPDKELCVELAKKIKGDLPSYLSKNVKEKTGYVSVIDREAK